MRNESEPRARRSQRDYRLPVRLAVVDEVGRWHGVEVAQHLFNRFFYGGGGFVLAAFLPPVRVAVFSFCECH